MERWTMEELESTDDITFAISILNQRRASLNPFSPLSMKLSHSISTLESIKAEKDRFIARLAIVTDGGTESVGIDTNNAETSERVCAEVSQTSQTEPGT